MSIGIYMIRNSINNKIYIGQSVNIERRWKDHKIDLKNNKHQNCHLQLSYNKYGGDNFEYNIIFKCTSIELNKNEIYFINKYKSYDNKYGYNQTFGGDNNIVFNDEVIAKMRNSHSYEYVPILKYDVNKELIKKYNSLSEASRDVDGTPSGIRNCANKFSYDIGNSKTYKSFIWIYEFDKSKFDDCDIKNYLNTQNSFAVNKYTYPDGKFICRYDTVTDAATSNNVTNDVISMCVRKVQSHSNGFTYRKALDSDRGDINIPMKKLKKRKPVVAYYADNNEFAMYIDDMQTLIDNGYHSGHICECCNGKRKTYKGYIWKYADEQFEKYFSEDGIKKVESKSLSDL